MTPPRTRTRYLRYALRTTSILLSFPRSRTLSSGTLRVVPSNGKRAYHRAFYAKGLTHGSRSQRMPDLPAVPLPNPTSSVAPAISITPHRHERAFSSGPRGSTIWYTTESHADVVEPPAVPAVAGHIYVHTNISTMIRQVWFYDANARWVAVVDETKIAHPTLSDRVLSIRSDGTPNWITPAGFTSTQHRRDRTRPVDRRPYA